MIDLHTHSTASDGRCTPQELVARAAMAGVTTLGLTDHDTVAGCAETAAACAASGVRFVPGIEVTTVLPTKDVHVLAYFIDTASPSFLAFLEEQRHRRLERVREMVARLAPLGVELDSEQILEPALQDSGKAAGRPWIARALVDRGYVATIGDAFDRWLGRGRPAYVPRVGPSPADAFERVHAAHGLVSLAHPGLSDVDVWIPRFIDAGLDAIEVYHSKHDGSAVERYTQLALQNNLLITGGSDFHGSSHGPAAPGAVTLPPEHFERLLARVGSR
ncbi:MAG: PHP domain-containing protein [Vicinamibacterales bacterium]